MIWAFIILGIVIIAVPSILQLIHVDIRGGEVLVGIAAAATIPQLLHGEWFTTVAEIGLLILMFEIGLDIDLERLKEHAKKSVTYGVLAFFAPFITAYASTYLYTQDLLASLVVAIGLSSTALAVVIPSMRREGIDAPVVANAAMVSEMIGITLLMGFVRAKSISLDVLFLELFSIVGFVTITVYVVPKIIDKLQLLDKSNFVDVETKIIFYIVFVLAVISEQLGIHAATGSFLAGLFLSESTHRGLEIEERIEPVTQLLVPIFFFHIGYQVQTSVITTSVLLVAAGLAAVTYVTRITALHWWGAISDFSLNIKYASLLAPCMTITATAAQIGLNENVMSQYLFTVFIFAGLILTIIGPAGQKAWDVAT